MISNNGTEIRLRAADNHFREAERLRKQAREAQNAAFDHQEAGTDPTRAWNNANYLNAAAQVHATLALAASSPPVPPGLCWHEPLVTWPDGLVPRCELRAGHAGAHECDRGHFGGGQAIWTDAEGSQT